MDNLRLFLWLTFLALLWLSYSAWVTDYAQPAPPAAETAPAANGSSGVFPEIDEAPAGAQGGAPAPPQPTAPPSELVHVRTDVLDLAIDLAGGDLVRADLLQYPVHKDAPDMLVRLLSPAPDDRWVFQSGWRAASGGPEPTHQARFRATGSEFVLQPGQDELTVTLEWVEAGAVTATKTYTFRRGSYAIDLQLAVMNSGAAPWRGAPYVQMTRVHRPPERSYTSVDSYSFTGPVLYDGEQYEKLDFDDLLDEPITQTLAGGWFAAIQHHFLAAAVPPPMEEFRYQASARGQEFVLSALGPVNDVAQAMPAAHDFKLFVGPKLQEQLAATASELDLTVDYGVLTVLAQPLFWVLSHVESWVGNWGFAIMIVTILIKLLFYKLQETSGRSMAKMRELAPRMKALQERYKEDRQALSQAMMDLYKREKVNPAAGCLPILVQMPFFFAFYWVLVESVEMRQAPFVLWIDDLSAQDPYYVLPILMGVAMFAQTRLNPTPPDPVQARVMQIMPLIFTVFFAFFPSGLVIYWLTNTVFGIAQQWRINKVVAAHKTA